MTAESNGLTEMRMVQLATIYQDAISAAATPRITRKHYVSKGNRIVRWQEAKAVAAGIKTPADIINKQSASFSGIGEADRQTISWTEPGLALLVSRPLTDGVVKKSEWRQKLARPYWLVTIKTERGCRV